jgi:hypothetical protein
MHAGIGMSIGTIATLVHLVMKLLLVFTQEFEDPRL